MWLDRGQAAISFALVSPLAEGHLKLNYRDWNSLNAEKFTNYVCVLSCPMHNTSQLMTDFSFMMLL